MGVVAGGAAGRARYCSPTGDLCYGAFGKGANVHLRITLMAGYFTHYRLCVTGPDRKTDCRVFTMHKASHGLYDSSVDWSRHFPFRGAGTSRAPVLGKWPGTRIDFVEGPSIHVNPLRVTAGHRVRVFGLAGGCPKGDAVTLLSSVPVRS